MTRKVYILGGIALILIALAVASLNQEKVVQFVPDIFLSRTAVFEKRVQEVLKTCADVSYRPTCYNNTIPTVMDKGFSLEEAFTLTTVVQQRDPEYLYCHVLGHNLAAKETAKDPSKWTEVVARCPSTICSNSCLHGATQERFREDVLPEEEIRNLLPVFSGICKPNGAQNTTVAEQMDCYHGIGHLFMYITGADIALSTDFCTEITASGNVYELRKCYEGAYMQIFQPLEPEDFALVKDMAPTTKETAEAFCQSFSGEREAACHYEAWPLYRDGLFTREGVDSYCALAPDAAAKERCYMHKFRVYSENIGFDNAKVHELCDAFPDERRAQCLIDIAGHYLKMDSRLGSRAIELCESVGSDEALDRCYNKLVLYSAISFPPESERYTAFCELLPDPWKTSCVNGEGFRMLEEELQS